MYKKEDKFFKLFNKISGHKEEKVIELDENFCNNCKSTDSII